MKIDPIHPLQSVAPSDAVTPKRPSETAGFASVLAQQLQQPTTQAPASRFTIQPTVLAPLIASSDMEVLDATDSLLQLMEHYQQALENPDVSLREMAPTTDRMNQAAERLASLVDNLPSEHPARSVVQQTLTTAYQEITRFETGWYVAE